MILTEFEPTLIFARALDRQDRLADFRKKFVIEDPDLIYLDGNSLGRLPIQTASVINEIIRYQWGQQLVRSWGESWMKAPLRIGDKLACLVGARPGEVIVADSVSTNLYKLIMAGLAIRPGRLRIISDTLNFPTDLYILQGCIQLLGGRHQIELLPTKDSITVDIAEVIKAIDQNTALITLSQVAFKSSFLYSVPMITQKAHESGALVLWDLSHSAGVIPIQLDQWQVDMAVGCTYKYINGGPGAPAFLYVNEKLQAELISPIWGWFGDRSPFAFNPEYQPADGIARFQAGTPPIISLLAIETGVDTLLEAGIDRIREKSINQTSYLIYLFDQFLSPIGFTLGTPRDAQKRGSHVSIRHPDGYQINQALNNEMKLIPDFREPDNIRLGVAPLYTRYEDLWWAVDRIRRVVVETVYLKYSKERGAVT